MYKKHHEKFKILDILAVTTQAREGIETSRPLVFKETCYVTTQAREGIETADKKYAKLSSDRNNSSPRGH